MTKTQNPDKQKSLLEETLNRIKTSPLRTLGTPEAPKKESPKCQ